MDNTKRQSEEAENEDVVQHSSHQEDRAPGDDEHEEAPEEQIGDDHAGYESEDEANEEDKEETPEQSEREQEVELAPAAQDDSSQVEEMVAEQQFTAEVMTEEGEGEQPMDEQELVAVLEECKRLLKALQEEREQMGAREQAYRWYEQAHEAPVGAALFGKSEEDEVYTQKATGKQLGTYHQEEQGGKITGTLYYCETEEDPCADGNPAQTLPIEMADIEVELSLLDSAEPYNNTFSVDGEGKFTADQLPVGKWRVVMPEVPGFQLSEPSLAEIDVHLESGKHVNLGGIRYEPKGPYIEGILFYDEDESGEPDNHPRLVGVDVTLRNLVTGEESHRTTDSHGRYVFDSPDPNTTYQLRFAPTLDAGEYDVGEGTLRLPATHRQSGALCLAPGQRLSRNVGYLLTGGDVHGFVFLDEDASQQRFGGEPGLPGVEVVLGGEWNRVVATRRTGSGGEYIFDNVPDGRYTVRFNTLVRDAQTGQEYCLTTEEKVPVHVVAGKTVEVPPAGYQREVHEIRGRVRWEDGEGVPNLVVGLAQNGLVIDTSVTDEEGNYLFENKRGDFQLHFPEYPYEGQRLSPGVRLVEVNSVAHVPDTVYRRSSSGRGGSGGGVVGVGLSGADEAIVDIASYMPTSQEGGGSNGWVSRRGEVYGELEHIADAALTAALGRRLRHDNPKAILASLNRAFVIESKDDRTYVTWKPHTYAVQTELGGEITGAQASLYHRAKSALDDALPLLDALEPLHPSPDQEEVDAVRAIVRTEFVELVNELGTKGGPRVQRVDTILALLENELERFQKVFGLNAPHIITVAEERRLTDFLVVRDYVQSLRDAWSSFRDRFTGSQGRFLGTQFVLLERALSVTAEAVDEVFRAMEAVNLGSQERQTVFIDFPLEIQVNGMMTPLLADTNREPVQAPRLSAEELLSWVLHVATEEGPALIEAGGRRGVAALEPMVEQLYHLVVGATQAPVQHIGFTRPRVRRALSELATQLEQVERLTRELTLDSVAPA